MERSTLALIEIDNSNEVYAALGQASLEIFLGAFEERLNQFVRTNDELIKVQPNKICILLNNVSEPVQIELAGAKLTRLFEAPFEVLEEEFKASVHTAFVPPRQDKIDNSHRLRIAESALIEARQRNEPFIVRDKPTEAISVSVKRPREIELAFERGEFVMHFQPLVHSNHRNIVAAEGLMRWHHPDGVRSPSDFIPYVDQSAVFKNLTWFALKSCIAQVSEWPSELAIAVNVSPLLLHDGDLIPNVEDALSLFDFPAARLVIEITEDAMIENPDRTLDVLSQLRRLGVKVAIDDFGTGFSSLAAFRDLPVDELKIDRSFVANMLTHSRDHDIVKSIIDLAHTFDMKVVAEGVEDEATADALQSLGADLLQGYWFGKPVEGALLEKMLV